jgi:hypothetical protein
VHLDTGVSKTYLTGSPRLEIFLKKSTGKNLPPFFRNSL